MLDAFKQFLSTKERLPEKNLHYYVKWVSDCYRYFLNHLAKKHEDWQVQQADRALRLYGYFLTRIKRNADGSSGDMPDNWKKIEEKTREALRLRHRSYSTEKTYILWLRQFQGFINGKQPLYSEGKDIQDFLSYLAVVKKVSASTQNQVLNAIVFSIVMYWIKISKAKSAQ